MDIIGGITKVVDYGVGGPGLILAKFAWWFYGTFIPFVIKWFGIPLFALGMLLAIAFAGGTALFTIAFFVVMFFFIKGVFFDSKPKILTM